MILHPDPEVRSTFSNMLYRSTYYVLTAYFVTFLLERLIMFTGAVILGYGINFDYEILKIQGQAHDWDQDAVLSLYMFPYFIFAALIVWMHLKIKKMENNPGYKQIFMYWMIFFFTYRLIGIVPSHLYCYTGIWHAFQWLYYGQIAIILISTLCFIGFFLLTVWLMTRIFEIYARINNSIDTIGVLMLALASFTWPAAIGCVVVFLFFLPGIPREEAFGLIAIALPVAFAFFRIILSNRDFSGSAIWIEEIFYQWQILAFVIFIILIIRIILGFGINIPVRL